MAKASNKEEQPKTKTPTGKKQQTVRQRAEKNTNRKPRRLRTTASKVTAPLKRANIFGKKEYHVVPLPSNKTGKILGKRVRFVPNFVKDAWNELRQVKWPNRHETIRLTIAVFIFSVVFAAIVGLLDFGLDKLFKEVILK